LSTYLRSARCLATVVGLLAVIAIFAAGHAYADREFMLVGTVDCGRPSGKSCSIDDQIRLWTDDVTGERARVVVDVSWIKNQLGSYTQDDLLCLEVRVLSDGTLQALGISTTCGAPPPTRRPTNEPRDERAPAPTATPTPPDTKDAPSGADLSLTKEGLFIDCPEGCDLAWRVTIRNDGPQNATNIVVAEFPGTDVTDCTGSPTRGSYDDVDARWAVGTLGVGEVATLDLFCFGNPFRTPILENVAEIIAVDQKDPDSTPNNHNPGEDDQARATLEAPTN
jgi:hypothetical protein